MTILIGLLISLIKAVVMGLLNWSAGKINGYADVKLGKGVLERWFNRFCAFVALFGMNLALYAYKHSVQFTMEISAAVAVGGIILYTGLTAVHQGSSEHSFAFDRNGSLIIRRPSLPCRLKRLLPSAQPRTRFEVGGIVAVVPSELSKWADPITEILIFTAPITLTLWLALLVYGSTPIFTFKVIFAVWIIVLFFFGVLGLLLLAFFALTFGVAALLYRTRLTFCKVVAWVWCIAGMVVLNVVKIPADQSFPIVDFAWEGLRHHLWGWHEVGMFLRRLYM
jgi:hypothetical protein